METTPETPIIVDHLQALSDAYIALGRAIIDAAESLLPDPEQPPPAAVVLPQPIDPADELSDLAEVGSRLSLLLCDLTGGLLSKPTYPVPVIVQAIEEHLGKYYESDAQAERDELAAKVERVRDWIDHRGVNVDDRDDDYMTGYRDAQRHALQDARGLLAILDGTDS